jgi:hypothetical protein
MIDFARYSWQMALIVGLLASFDNTKDWRGTGEKEW